MSVQSQITRLSIAKSDIKEALESKGLTVPDDATLDQYAALINSIDVGQYIRYDQSQTLTSEQQATARANIGITGTGTGDGSSVDAYSKTESDAKYITSFSTTDEEVTVTMPYVEYTQQSLTAAQKNQVKTNIGITNDFTDTYKTQVDILWGDYQDALDLI